MEDAVKKRIVGAAVLVLLGVMLPLLLAKFLHDPQTDRQATHIYEITPSGQMQEVREVSDTSAQAPEALASAGEQADAGMAPMDIPSEESSAGGPSVDEGHADDDTMGAGGETAAATVAEKQPDSSPAAAAPASGSKAESEAAASAGQPDSKPSESEALAQAAAVAAGDWVIQVASFGKRDNAQALEQELGADFPTFHARAQINDQTWYRVRVGPFASRAEAENVAGELRAQGHNTLVQQLD